MLEGYEGVVLRLAVDMKLIDTAVSAQAPVTAQALAEQSGADIILVQRLMRMLVAMSFFEEAQAGFVPKPHARAYVSGSPLREAVIHL